MNIDFEKFICSYIQMAEDSVTIGTMSEVMDGEIFKGALREQGLTYKHGKIIRIEDDHEEAVEHRYLVYDIDNDKFFEVPDKPELASECDMYLPVDGTPFVIRHSDYCAHVAHDIAVKGIE